MAFYSILSLPLLSGIAEDGIVVLNVDCFSGDVSWTYNYDITRITIESLCGNDTQVTNYTYEHTL